MALIANDVCWTALPHGSIDGACFISVVAAPITKDLAEDTVWADWSRHVGELHFRLEFKGNKRPINLGGYTPPLKDCWTALFPQPPSELRTTVLKTQKRPFNALTPRTSFSSTDIARLGRDCVERNSAVAFLLHLARSGEKNMADRLDQSGFLRQDPLPTLRYLRRDSDARVSGANLLIKQWVDAQIAEGDAKERSIGRRVERNAYRLSSHPWTELHEAALAVAWRMGVGRMETLYPAMKIEIDRVMGRNTEVNLEAVRFAIFHGRVRAEKTSARTLTAAEAAPLPSLAAKIAMLNNYPELKRALGLVIDFKEVKHTPDAADMALRIVALRGADKFGYSPWTKVDENFFVAPAHHDEGSNLYVAGMLKSAYLELHSVESDGLVHKLSAQVNSARLQATGADDDDPTIGAPRGHGITICLKNREQIVGAQLAASAAVGDKPDEDKILSFEALVRGYAVFVKEEGKDVQSLCDRNESYCLGANGLTYSPPSVGHGFVAPAMTTTNDELPASSNDSQTEKDPHIHDAIATWRGWSLAVRNPMPWAPLDLTEEEPSDTEPDPKRGPFVKAKFSVPKGSLPRLRFGRSYRFIIGCADAAGFFRPPAEAPPSAISPPHKYLRFDPVPPPEVLLAEHLSTEISPGEQLDRIVLRTTGNSTSDGHLRVIAPPRCSLQLAEQCGMFDHGRTPFHVGSFDAIYTERNGKFAVDHPVSNWPLISRGEITGLGDMVRKLQGGNKQGPVGRVVERMNARTLETLLKFQTTSDAAGGGDQAALDHLEELLIDGLNRVIRDQSFYDADAFEAVALRTEIRAMVATPRVAWDISRLNRFLLEDVFPELTPAKENPIYRMPQFPKPCQYVPDPFAFGFRLGVTDVSGDLRKPVWFANRRRLGDVAYENGELFLDCPFYRRKSYDPRTDWPRASIWLLEARREDAGGRVTVSVETRVIPRSGGRRARAIVVKIPQGREVTITLHSWVDEKDLARMEVPMQLGKTVRAWADMRLDKHGAAVLARKLSTVPIPAATPVRRISAVHAVDRPMIPEIVFEPSGVSAKEATFYEEPDFQVALDRATSGKIAIQSHWEEAQDAGPGSLPPATVRKSTVVCDVTVAPPQSLNKKVELASLAPPNPPTEPKAGYRERHVGRDQNGRWLARIERMTENARSGGVRFEFGDTRHRVLSVSVAVEGRFNDYLLKPGRIVNSDSKLIIIPNKAVPPPVSVASIAPLFKWTEGWTADNPRQHMRTRAAGGCRIWLNRPWNMTGVGERLGIVVWKDSHSEQGDFDTREMVTRWGADPVWTIPVGGNWTTSRPNGPKASEIQTDCDCDSPVTLEGYPAAAIKPISPNYDKGTDLFFVDVHFPTVPSYFRFVRFALVRFQPNSIAGCFASSITLATFVQLTPGRSVSIVRGEGWHTLKVFLHRGIAAPGKERMTTLEVQRMWGPAASRRWWTPMTGPMPPTRETAELDEWLVDFTSGNGTEKVDVGSPKRIVVREFEVLPSDSVTGNTGSVRRLVFAEALIV